MAAAGRVGVARPLQSLLCGLSMLVALSGSASAQAADPGQRLTRMLTINPPFVLVGGYVAEVEAGLWNGVSVGVGAIHYDIRGDDDDRSSAAEVKLRDYPLHAHCPQNAAPVGVAFGLTAGVARADNDDCCEDVEPPAGVQTSPSSGAIVDYSVRLGRGSRGVAGTGLGLKRYFGALAEDGFLDGSVAPTFRPQMGAAF